MRRLAAVFALLLTGALAAPAAAAPSDFAFNLLAPGQFGGLPLTANSTDQASLYDALTPLRGNVTTDDIQRLYKPENFRPNGTTRVEHTGRPGLVVLRDCFDVPHIYGKTRADVWFGAGFVTGRGPWPPAPARARAGARGGRRRPGGERLRIGHQRAPVRS